jgi:hypothetical protein
LTTVFSSKNDTLEAGFGNKTPSREFPVIMIFFSKTPTSLSSPLTAFFGVPVDDDMGSVAGAVYEFDGSGGTWAEVAKHYSPTPAAFDAFGADTYYDGVSFLVGAYAAGYVVIDSARIGGNYCSVNPNSTGVAAEISTLGQCEAATNDLSLSATQLPPNKFGYFLLSQNQGFFPNPGNSEGNLCIAGPIGRFQAQVQNSGPAGAIAINVDLTNVPLFGSILAGETWNFTCWYRDVGGNSNFTGGIEIPFQ